MLRPRLVLAALCSLALAACPKEPEPAAADAGPEPSLDAGEVDAGPPPCRRDDDCPADQRCDDTPLSVPKCVPAAPCQGDPALCRNAEYCDPYSSLGCRCVASDLAPKPNTGFCKRRLAACTPCQSDAECGPDPFFFSVGQHTEGHCVELDGQRVCLERYDRNKCTCGTERIIDGKHVCAPQEGSSCAAGELLCCKGDAQCPRTRPLCRQETGLCQEMCRYDPASEQTVGCPPGKVCNVMARLVENPGAATFGAGLCGPSCGSDADCQSPPYGREDFICKAEKNSAPRCRPSGCINDFECPQPAADGPFKDYVGFCNREDYSCVCAPQPGSPCYCRTGKDPATGTPYADCTPGFGCVEGAVAGRGTCVKKDCLQEGGAELACGLGRFCCGEDRDHDGDTSNDPCVDGAGATIAKPGECYKAPKPPWCTPCSSANECVGGGMPVSERDPTLCMDMGAGMTCLPGCTWRTQCPTGFSCKSLPVYCSDNPAMCKVAERCVKTGEDANKQPIMQCTCTTPGARGGECPDGTRCDDQGKFCIYTQACVAGSGACGQ